MASVFDEARDAYLQAIIDAADTFHLCVGEPTTAGEVTSMTAGNAPVSIGAPEARAGGGRKSTVAAISDGTVTEDEGEPTHYAMVDELGEIVVTNDLANLQVVFTANGFNTSAFDLELPPATSL